MEQVDSLSDAVIGEILAIRPMHRKFIKRSLSKLNADEHREVEQYITFLGTRGLSSRYVAECYLTIVDDTFQEELYFKEHGKYRFSTFEEANSAVYANAEYMNKYMVGLALSSFWWSNHTEMRRFHKKHLPTMAKKSGVYREVGPGHGMYFMDSVKNTGFDHYEGLDISPTSIEMTNSIIDSGFFGNFEDKKISIVEVDFLMGKNLEPADALVMGEVLEHVENPGAFLARSYETTTQAPFFFLTTCINAPAIDHLYNPETVENLELLFQNHGFAVADKCIIPRDGLTLAQCEQGRYAINVAYVLAKN